MIKELISRIADTVSGAAPEPGDRDATLRMATAILLTGVARADHVFDESEFDKLLEIIAAHFELSAEDAAELVIAAKERADDLVSIYEFTQLLHEHLDDDDKARVVSLLWQVAYADGQLDKYEDSLVLKISDLLYVSRGRVMRLKYDAALAAGQG